MTEHDPGDRELTTEQEAHVRRLLADVRHQDPVPDAVVARLERVLTDLAGEPVRNATVVRLADRRRRAATMLVAAAASVVAVIGVSQLIANTDDEVDAASSAEQDDSAGEQGDAGSDPDGTVAPTPQSGEVEASGTHRRQLPYELEADQFAQDAGALQRKAQALDATLSGSQRQGGAAGRLDRVKDRAVCEPGAWGGGDYVAVLYDDAEGWVVLRRPQGDTQVADLFLCGSESVTRSVTLTYE